MQELKINILFLTYRADKSGGPLLLSQLLEDMNRNSQRSQFGFYMGCPKNEALTDSLKATCDGYVELANGLRGILSFFKILSLCRKNSIKLVHSHGRGAGYFSRFLGLFGIRVIHSLHGVHADGGWKTKVKSNLERLVAPLTDAFVVSSHSEEMAGKWFGFISSGALAEYIPHGVDLTISRKDIFQNQFQVIGTLTRLEEEKGNLLLLEFFRDNLKDKNWKLLIAGDGTQKGPMLSFIEKYELNSQIELVGFVQDKDQFLNQLDIFISFSKSEGMPLSVIEAMSKGIPCLLSHVRGHVDFNANKLLIWTFNRNNNDDCYTALKKIVDVPSEREMRILNSLSFVQNLLELKWSENYYRLYHKMSIN